MKTSSTPSTTLNVNAPSFQPKRGVGGRHAAVSETTRRQPAQQRGSNRLGAVSVDLTRRTHAVSRRPVPHLNQPTFNQPNFNQPAGLKNRPGDRAFFASCHAFPGYPYAVSPTDAYVAPVMPRDMQTLFFRLLPYLFWGEYDVDAHAINYRYQEIRSGLREQVTRMLVKRLHGCNPKPVAKCYSFLGQPALWLNAYFVKQGVLKYEADYPALKEAWIRLNGCKEWLHARLTQGAALHLPFNLSDVMGAMPYKAVGKPLMKYLDLGTEDESSAGLSDHAPVLYLEEGMAVWNIAQQAGVLSNPSGVSYTSAKFIFPQNETQEAYLTRQDRIATSIADIFRANTDLEYMLLQEVASPLPNVAFGSSRVEYVNALRSRLNDELRPHGLSIFFDEHQAIVWRSGAPGWHLAPELKVAFDKSEICKDKTNTIRTAAKLVKRRVSPFVRSDQAQVAVSCHGYWRSPKPMWEVMRGMAHAVDQRYPNKGLVFAGDFNCTALELMGAATPDALKYWTCFEPNRRRGTHSINNEGHIADGAVDLCFTYASHRSL